MGGVEEEKEGVEDEGEDGESEGGGVAGEEVNE